MMEACKNLEEFVTQYDRDLERILRSRSFRWYWRHLPDEYMEELKNEIYANLAEKGFFTGYDPSKGAFSTWLYAYIRTYFQSQKSVNKDILAQATSIEIQLDGEKYTLLDRYIPEPPADELDVEWDQIKTQVKACLQKKYKRFDAWGLFEEMQKGTKNKDLCQKLDYTVQTVRTLKASVLKDVRKCVAKVRSEPDNKIFAYNK